MKSAPPTKSPQELNEAFLKSAARGDLKAIHKWISDGMPVIWPGAGQTTALMCAAENGHADAVKLLIENGAELNTFATGRWTAIALATARGHEAVVKILLDEGANPNVETKLGDTPLSLATKSGNKRVAHLLESSGARLATSKPLDEIAYKCVRQFSKSKLSSVSFGRPPTARTRKTLAKEAEQLLKEVGRMVSSGAKGGDYALWSAAGSGYCAFIKLLLKAKANPNFAPHISSALSAACEHGHLEAARLLLDAGASINYGGTGLAPILEATKNGHIEIVAELCKRGANVNVRSRIGPTPLLLATTAANHKLMCVLLDAKADVNQTGTVEIGPRPKPTVEIDHIEGSKIASRTTHFPDAPKAMDVTPLIVAVHRNNIEATKLLLSFGAKLELTDKEGMTALAWARRLKLHEVQDILIKAGADASVDDDGSPENALIVAASSGKQDRVRQLLGRRANANAHVDSVEERKTALTAAAKAGHVEIVQALLRAGAEVDKPIGTRFGTRLQTALMLASEAGHAEIVRLLIDAKANVDAADAELFGGGGHTPLHYAARGGSREVVQLLLNAGANRSAKNKSGDTPLRIASSYGRKGVIDLLLASGGRVVARKGRASSMLHEAAFSGDLAAVKRLLKANPRAHGCDLDLASSVCFGAKLEVIKALVDAGMPVEGKDREGETPLMNAVRAGRTQVVKFLLSNGANPKTASKERKTPISIAREFGHKQVLGLLRKSASNPRP